MVLECVEVLLEEWRFEVELATTFIILLDCIHDDLRDCTTWLIGVLGIGELLLDCLTCELWCTSV